MPLTHASASIRLDFADWPRPATLPKDIPWPLTAKCLDAPHGPAPAGASEHHDEWPPAIEFREDRFDLSQAELEQLRNIAEIPIAWAENLAASIETRKEALHFRNTARHNRTLSSDTGVVLFATVKRGWPRSKLVTAARKKQQSWQQQHPSLHLQRRANNLTQLACPRREAPPAPRTSRPCATLHDPVRGVSDSLLVACCR